MISLWLAEPKIEYNSYSEWHGKIKKEKQDMNSATHWLWGVGEYII